jgi:D-sedoheptulose 7-phosphate isomerase
MKIAPSWSEFSSQIHSALYGILFTNRQGNEIPVIMGFDRWRSMAIDVRKIQKTLFLIGNGASASMASHFAADLAKNAHLHTQVFSDLALITAVSNDMSYKDVFSEPLKHSGNKGDMLVAISSSGISPNIISAIKVARQKRIAIVTLSAMKAGNAIRKMGDLNIYINAASYGLAETCHAAILHHWMDLLEIRKRKESVLHV